MMQIKVLEFPLQVTNTTNKKHYTKITYSKIKLGSSSWGGKHPMNT